MVRERLQALRERVQRREKATRARRRAKSRRIDRGEPEGAAETVRVRGRQAKEGAEMTAEQARGLANDARTLVATELGVSGDDAESVIKQGAELLDSAGERADQLDFDADGDTDILNAMEPVDDSGGGSDGGLFDPMAESENPDEGLYDPMNDDDLL